MKVFIVQTKNETHEEGLKEVKNKFVFFFY